jgi:glutaredoxin 3
MLESRGIDYEERNITQGTWTREQLLEAVPTARTLPQIFLDQELVGGFTDLRKKRA